ncbi:hypothetical protein JF546_02635 [Nitratireductor aquimarinus]|uniref:hypothetical protein n=1 Tax=Nitratireductor aquimarinus TaxID=889300 RepID=UPI001A904288|nr:hypothetical protein [Nitratireductor aquimarinus]MBN8241905.1 hypothetical protein [Nitratireductor aquimarinus]MBY6130291.1 hypothetical protein [Nitratireductor aquimarinus]MCA1305080.1 hypothetical protein [Nitratireductor aquimarinus]
MADKFAAKLLDAADNIENLTHAELQVLLRRAALRIGNRTQLPGTTILEREISRVIDEFAATHAIPRDDAANLALRDWAISMGFIEIDDLNNEGDEP